MIHSIRPKHARAARAAGLLLSAVAFMGLSSPVAAQSETIRQYQVVTADGRTQLAVREVPRPTPGANEVLVRVRAASLNHRDLLVLQRRYPGANAEAVVPLSDGAGEVIAVGPGVTRFGIGDRVAGTFFADWVDGRSNAAALATARGGNVDGMLSEMIISHENGLVAIPDYLTFEEAATLPCAGLTAWNALFKLGDLDPDDVVLLEGTGGVSVFGLQFAVAAGARAIITSSSDEKLARARELGAFGTVNYRSQPEWPQEVMRLTGGAGADHILEVGGEDTLPRALQSLAYHGHITLIGGLTGFAGEIPVGSLMGRSGRVSGIYVGSRADFEAMNAFLEEHRVRPLVDRVFPFEEAPAAFEFMENGQHFGKIVIAL